ncbi:MAG TPA: alpha/beta hydrolase [Saprospiraceae bacterium]|nr:alpha/beta hydrolase [Saprospiraceae bacterium]HMQ81727.1 alpha/beta hydrolase [Saprospiraceae bacterium]
MLSFVLLFLLLLSVFYLFQNRFIYQTSRLEKNYRFDFKAPFEEVWLKTSDGENIQGLFFPASEEKGVVLYLHGNRGHLQRWGAIHDDFLKNQYSLFVIDYRGYGKSSGKPTEQGLYQDALSAYQWLEKQYAPENIAIYGRSLGSGVAAWLAAEAPQSKMLLLETPYDRLPNVISYRYSPLLRPLIRSTFPSDTYLEKVECPVYIFAATEDQIVPFFLAERLATRHLAEDHFFAIEGAHHKNIREFKEYHFWLGEVLK